MSDPIRRFGGRMFESTSAASVRAAIEASYESPLGPGSPPAVDPNGPRRIVGLVAPHAGYVWSGPGAAHCYHRLAADGVPEVLVVIGLSHRGLPSATQVSGAWETPLGLLPIAADVAERLRAGAPELREGPAAHGDEWSLEMHLPFLQHLYGDRVPFVPLMVGPEGLTSVQLLGQAVADACAGRSAVLIASTDMTHYEPKAVAQKQDHMLIEHMLHLDPEALWHTQRRHDISMCGIGPTAAMLTAAKALGATHAELLSYHTSGDVGPMADVVGYAAVALLR